MPCCCHYDPPEESKKKIKRLLQEVVDEVKQLEKIGDPFGLSIHSLHRLLDHLYQPSSCEEKGDIK